jgi:hypothetical protein
MTFTLLQQPTYKNDGLEIKSFDYLQDPEFKSQVASTYATFNPARNAKNTLCRAVRWGMFANDELTFSSKNTYQLDIDLNIIEGGRVRVMDLIPDELIQTSQVQSAVRDVFNTFYPDADSFNDTYIVQMSAIRYEPTPAQASYPSPDMPHQDGFNNGIIVLNVTPNIVGGNTRIYDLNNRLRYEARLTAGQGLFVEDKRWKNQVYPMLVDTCPSQPDKPCYRDILIIRIDPAKR